MKSSLFANRNFTLLYLGQLVSLFGDWFKTIALIGVTYALYPHASAVGGMFIASVLPVLFGGIIMGPLVDRLNKKKIMIYVDIARSLLSAAVIYGAWVQNIWIVYIFIAASALVSSLFAPARATMLPELVGKDKIVQATSSFALLNSVAMAVATALGGFVADWVGPYAVLWYDAASYLFSAVCIYFIQYAWTKPSEAKARVPYLQQVKEGIVYVKNRPQLVAVYNLQFWRDFCLGYVYILFSLYILNELQAGNSGIGIGYSITAIAYIIGAFFIKRYFKKKPFDDTAFFKIYFPFNILYGIGLGVTFSIHNWPLFLAFLLVTNIFQSGVNIVTETSLLTYSDPSIRGRVYASWLSMSRLAYGIALPLFSAVGEWIPISQGGKLLTVIIALSTLVLIGYLKSRLARLQAEHQPDVSIGG
ncbi:MFS transporter [Tumebacillus sp. ITR2]|uniref:MFS transporter n=1 Tax=Tumebacillus amylolyticus TaxID=2801339 RepID=A0ABS1JC10_9BACL|nr:MFS transporter [Tumebacillus amylolyticus]MBL0387806.1 MFS transporter [Tumebacillus amylolyticus]